MTLYLKYRPKTLSELDLSSVRDTLSAFVRSGSIPHAMLFAGPKGLGKTSAARIVAKIANCENLSKGGEPCNKCDHCKAIDVGTHLDVYELDAASHRGIDDVRVLREGVKLSPAQGTKKVYIIDEAHMLTTEASNALLKTLEEPPEHVMFILATTNPEKLIDTIRSRASQVLFSKPSQSELVGALTKVVKGEGLEVGEGFLETLAQNSGGSFRDAVKKLDALMLSGKPLNKDSIEVQGSGEVDSLLASVFEHDQATAFEITRRVENAGTGKVFIDNVIERLREALLANAGVGDNKIAGVKNNQIVSFLNELITNLDSMKVSPIESLPLEITIAQWCAQENGHGDTPKEQEESQKSTQPSKKKVSESPPERDFSDINAEEKSDIAEDNGTVPNGNSYMGLDSSVDEIWKSLLAKAGPKNKSVETLLRSAKPLSFDGNTLNVGVFYSFHKERLEAQPHRRMVDEIVSDVFGKNVKVVCCLTKPDENVLNKVSTTEGVVLSEPQGSSVLTQRDDKDIIKLAEEIFSS